MNKIKNLKIRKAFLTVLSGMVLVGCNSDVRFGSSRIEYNSDSNIDNGKIFFDDIDDNIKVVELVDKDTSMSGYRLVYLDSNIDNSQAISHHYRYIDLKSGVEILNYKRNSSDQVYYPEGNISIGNEVNILPYLISTDNIKKEYDISELIDLCDNVIIPDMENDKKFSK